MLNNLTPEEKKKFWIRLGCFITVGFLAPIIYLIARYKLFTTTDPGIAIGLWGCIVFAILVALVGVLVWFYLESVKTKHTLLKQILHGVMRVILPMLVVVLFLTWFKNNVDMVIEALWVFIGCEAVAIPINPLPKWAFDNNVEGMGTIAKKIYDNIVPNKPESGETPKASETPKESK